MLLVCFKQTQKKHFSIFFFSESYKLFLISLAPRARAALLTFQIITGNVSPCKALVFPDRLLPSRTPLCAQSHYHKSHHVLPRQLRNLVTPGSPLKIRVRSHSAILHLGSSRVARGCRRSRPFVCKPGHTAQYIGIRGQRLSKQKENNSLPFTAPLQSCQRPSQGSPSYLIKLILSAKISVSSLVGVTFSTKAIPYNKKFCRNSFSPSSVSRKLRQSTDGTWAWR